MRIYPIVPALLLGSVPAAGAEPCRPAVVKAAVPSEIRAFFDGRRLQAVTFMGFSGASTRIRRRCSPWPDGRSTSTPRRRRSC